MNNNITVKVIINTFSRLNLNGGRVLCGAATGIAPDDREYYNDMPDKTPPETTTSYRHPPPPPLASLASLAPISS